jgi:phosphoribosylanthranilate isomerase
MSIWVKICGVTDEHAIEAAVKAGVDAIGFVFHAASPRNLDVARARELGRLVPAGVLKIAVMRDPAQMLIDTVLREFGPDQLQLDLADLAHITVPAGTAVLPVLRTGQSSTTALPTRFLFEGAGSGIGERADWQMAKALAPHGELVLAGGLDAGTVHQAITSVRPFGVDVSSGVESIRGRKDPRKIVEFVEAARSAAG